MNEQTTTEQYHLVGIAGVGMSALAEALLARGCAVSGSDRFIDQGQELDVLKTLERAGVRLFPQDGSGVHANLTAVIISSAVEEENSDFCAAEKLGIPVIKRAKKLAELTDGKHVVAVAGTAGKTTVTGMLGWILADSGLDPNVVNGGEVLGWKNDTATGSTRSGQADLWVVEVDESDRSLLEFSPQHAVITNISGDHFDMRTSVDLFRRFAEKVHEKLICGPDAAEMLGRDRPELPVPEYRDGTWEFRFDEALFRVPLPGEHNAWNAILAVRMALDLGAAGEKVRESLATFPGIRRRLQVLGSPRGIRVVDDYAHNPAKIQAAWEAFQEDQKRIIGVWRPHGFGPLALMKDELAKMLKGVMRADDHLFVLPVFYAGGTAERSITSKEFVEFLHAEGASAAWVEDYDSVQQELIGMAREGDVIIYMGARDPEIPLAGHRLCKALEALP